MSLKGSVEEFLTYEYNTMPMKKSGSKRYPRRKVGVRRRPRRMVKTNDYARCVETHEFATLNANTAYFDYATSLARCERASAIARGYQEFRIKKVEYHFIPMTDTFLPGQNTVPQLYFRIDKTGALNDFTSVSQLVQTGCKPRRMDDKNIVVKFAPGVLTYARDAVNATNPWSEPKISPWLTTNKNNLSTVSWSASSIDHLGLAWFVEQINTGGAVTTYSLREVVHFEFRKPLVLTTSSEEPPAIQAPLKASPEAD